MNNSRKYRSGLVTVSCFALILGTAVARADGIQVISDNELLAVIAATHGKLVVHLSSFDNGCGPCVNSNPSLDALAKEFANKATFRRVATKPWNHVGPEMNKYKVMGLPSVFLFQDGKLVQKYMGTGNASYAPLRTKLAE
jgi:thiol-disulfide isomerase/thioredoxin